MTGLISVWPKKLKIGTPGNTRAIFFKTSTGVLAAPHEARRRESCTPDAVTWSQMSSHCMPTNTQPVTP